MIFLQLPDVLPGIPPCQDEDRLKVKTDQTSNSSGTSAAQNSNEEEVESQSFLNLTISCLKRVRKKTYSIIEVW